MDPKQQDPSYEDAQIGPPVSTNSHIGFAASGDVGLGAVTAFVSKARI